MSNWREEFAAGVGVWIVIAVILSSMIIMIGTVVIVNELSQEEQKPEAVQYESGSYKVEDGKIKRRDGN